VALNIYLEFKAIEIALQIDSLFLQAFRYSRSSSHSRADKTPSADLLGLLGDAESKSHTPCQNRTFALQ
jgi:hypothetical protein